MIVRFLLSCVIATPAMAACPVGEDLTKGIVLKQLDGTQDSYRAVRPGVVEAISRYSDGYVARTLLGQGIYVLEVAELVDGAIDPYGRTSFAFQVAADKLPLPEPNSKARFATTVRDGAEIYAEDIVVDWGTRTTVTYGDCSYPMIPAVFSHTSADYDHEEVIHYLPDLGITVLHSYFDDEMSAPDVYEVVDIQASKG